MGSCFDVLEVEDPRGENPIEPVRVFLHLSRDEGGGELEGIDGQNLFQDQLSDGSPIISVAIDESVAVDADQEKSRRTQQDAERVRKRRSQPGEPSEIGVQTRFSKS